jgi:eukaryotic-like serine/threonine-protein kinase
MPNPVPGTLLGSYQVEGVIGAGSMGDVFRGVDTGLGRKVAIKILAEKHRDSPELRARFIREGRAVAAIQHPNVVQVFANGTFDERPFIAMEFLEGADLGSSVEKNAPLPSLVAAQAILDAAHGLDAASRAGLIHRDVKPSNLVRLKDGRVKVTDFGLAKPVDPGSEPALTALGVVVGTPDYIAPEQARGEAIDEKVDIYALGGTLYFLLTGVPPFRTGKPAEDKYLKVVARHLRQPPPDAHQVNAAADGELAQLARQMMAKRPVERPDYPQLIASLEGIVERLATESGVPRKRASTQRSQPITSPPTPYIAADSPPAFSDQMDTLAGGTDVRAALAEARGGPPRWTIALTALSAAFFVFGAIFYLTRDGASHGATPTPPPDAARVATAPDAPPAQKPPPAAPAGMILVTKSDGTPWFFVDKQPVTNKDYAAFYRKHKIPKNGADKPVAGVDYTFARAYAQTVHKRMIRAEEYEAAARASGFAMPPGMMEWVDAGKDPQDMLRSPGKIATTKTVAEADITFRFAQDL